MCTSLGEGGGNIYCCKSASFTADGRYKHRCANSCAKKCFINKALFTPSISVMRQEI